ncbi:MAG TPA: hypothetical protein VFU31_24400 [Candidatus Binatia bacterium]|nr:hypothetical protein [Candidatus Binatia bacterium]
MALVLVAVSSVAVSFVYSTYYRTPVEEKPLQVVKAYLKASYARDYREAYLYISSTDRRVRDQNSFVRAQGSFSGFTLQLAKKLADDMELWVVEKEISSDRARYKVGYRMPAAEELSALTFAWDSGKLNSLSPAGQKQLLTTLERLKRQGKMIMTEGQETFDLVSDQGSWKIFFDWGLGIKVTLKADSAPSNELEARFAQSEFIIKQNEPFQIDLKVKNHGQRELIARIVHHLEPAETIDYVDMIACGALAPLVLRPGDEREISSAYVIRDGVRPDTPVAITYEFKLEPSSSKQAPAPTRSKGAHGRAATPS